jgi:hypothetical protein
MLIGVVVGMERDAHLLQIILAFGASRRLTYFLDGGQKQTDENGNNRNNNQ